jgi:hypothetical protein
MAKGAKATLATTFLFFVEWVALSQPAFLKNMTAEERSAREEGLTGGNSA